MELQKTGANIDDEDNDYLFLYNEYCSFLKKNNMFEPSWVDSKFVETQKKFIILNRLITKFTLAVKKRFLK